jgi:hypothetical protein
MRNSHSHNEVPLEKDCMNNRLSFSSVKLDLFSKEGIRLKHASGFVLESGNKYYIITNWHVLSGRQLSAHEPPEPVVKPSILKTTIHLYSGEGENSFPLFMGMRKRITLPLYDDNDSPSWIESHSTPQQTRVDIVALPIQVDLTMDLVGVSSPRSYVNASSWSKSSNYWTKVSAVSISAIDTDVKYGPPDTVHIIGYPVDWAPEGPEKSTSAFWRTSFIASEIYEAGRTRSDVFFIDPCAPQGMTGSPVVGLKNNRLKLLGVYSDESTAEVGANAGYVWGAWLLKELIPQRRAG